LKVVYCNPGDIYSQNITEVELDELMKSSTWQRVATKAPYEIIRLRSVQTNELAIIYQNNRKFRSKNEWIEKRAIKKFLEIEKSNSNVILNYEFSLGTYSSEIDGIMCDNGFEIKNQQITKEYVKLLEKKRLALKLNELIIIGKSFTNDINPQDWPNHRFFTFIPDWKKLTEYYLKKMRIDPKIESVMQKRHVRYLLSNGNWKSQKRRYTKTAKRTAFEKYKLDLSKFLLPKNKSKPVKIYWSLNEMLAPIDEYRGKGWPLDSILAAFDIDGDHNSNHTISNLGFCEPCMKSSRYKLNRVKEILGDLGHDYTIYYSGNKGFHIYLTSDGDFLWWKQEKMQEMTQVLQPYVDQFLAKTTREFDNHRIFKILIQLMHLLV
jgi:hypothetical protein